MSQLRPNKLLVFHLRGAPNGPHSIQADVSQDPYSAAHALWALTRMGTVGRRFEWCDKEGKAHGYKVIDKREDTNAIIITCEHLSRVDNSAS